MRRRVGIRVDCPARFSLDYPRRSSKNGPVRTCVIFNPTAKGDKARYFRRHLDTIGAECALKQTAAAGGARPLAAEAVREGFQMVVAAGGDGTLNEVLNGIGDEPGGFDRICLGVLPLGTVNVFAKELRIPSRLPGAWEVIRSGTESRIDLLQVEYVRQGAPARHYFAQLAGAGLDARAIELVNWELKKKVGPLAYIWAGFAALRGPLPRITATAAKHSATGELVLIGNGRYYGGRYPVFPRADLRNGKMEVCVFPRTNWLTLLRCARMFAFGADLPASAAKTFATERLTLTSPTEAPLEVDGELIGHLPASFTIERQKLRVIVPG